MPEGHTIHRYARLHRGDLAGHTVRVTSPQGRFAAGAERLDGQVLDDVDAVGKHLFYHWGGGEVLHVHLGLFGKFRTIRSGPAVPTQGTRLAMTTEEVTIFLAGPTACDVLTPDEVEAITDRLGPDPLRPDADREEFSRRLGRRKVALGAALLDQKVIAGIGNVYRSEIPFLAGIDPNRSARDLDVNDHRLLWDLTTQELKRGQKSGRIVTVEPADVGARRRSDLDRSTRVYVYKRGGDPCRRCETPIRQTEITGRKMWWCPSCQPSG
ncbi:MAG: DNA-formamidopyrimidine glycosylase family protein [Actinomycetota bacterium]